MGEWSTSIERPDKEGFFTRSRQETAECEFDFDRVAGGQVSAT